MDPDNRDDGNVLAKAPEQITAKPEIFENIDGNEISTTVSNVIHNEFIDKSLFCYQQFERFHQCDLNHELAYKTPNHPSLSQKN